MEGIFCEEVNGLKYVPATANYWVPVAVRYSLAVLSWEETASWSQKGNYMNRHRTCKTCSQSSYCAVDFLVEEFT